MKDGEQQLTDAGLDSAAPAFLAMLVLLTFVMNTVGRGVTETFAVFLLPVERALGASRSEMSLTYSIYMLVHGLAAPAAGQLIDRLGARITYGTGLCVLGAGYALAGFATTPWHYYLTVGLLGGLGASCLGMVVASSLLARWFSQRLGSIMALPYAAIGAGVLVIPPLTQLLLERVTWQAAHCILGLATLALLPLVMVLPLTRMTAGSAAWRSARVAAQSGMRTWTVRAVARTRAFRTLFVAYLATSIAAYSVLPQTVAFLVEQGFEPLVAAGAFGLTGALSVVGIIGMGWVSDRVGRLPAITVSYIFTMLGTVCLILVAWFPALVLVYGFVLFFGIMQGARGPMVVALLATLFRGGAIGGIVGMMSLALGFGAGLASWLSGLLRDLTGGYVASFSLGIAGSLTGLAMFWLVPNLRRERVEAPTTGS